MGNIPMKGIPTFEELEASDKFDDYGQMARWWCKQHVTAALKAASKNVEHYEDTVDINKDTILNAYPLTNIE